MSDCPAAGDLASYLNDELTADASRALEAHVEGCAACQRQLEALSGEGLTERLLAARKPKR